MKVRKRKLKRTSKRLTNQPHTTISNFGQNTVVEKIDKAIKILDNKK